MVVADLFVLCVLLLSLPRRCRLSRRLTSHQVRWNRRRLLLPLLSLICVLLSCFCFWVWRVQVFCFWCVVDQHRRAFSQSSCEVWALALELLAQLEAECAALFDELQSFVLRQLIRCSLLLFVVVAFVFSAFVFLGLSGDQLAAVVLLLLILAAVVSFYYCFLIVRQERVSRLVVRRSCKGVEF